MAEGAKKQSKGCCGKQGLLHKWRYIKRYDQHFQEALAEELANVRKEYKRKIKKDDPLVMLDFTAAPMHIGKKDGKPHTYDVNPVWLYNLK